MGGWGLHVSKERGDEKRKGGLIHLSTPCVLKNLENSMNVIKKGFVNVAEEEILSIIRISISFFHCRNYSEGFIHLIK